MTLLLLMHNEEAVSAPAAPSGLTATVVSATRVDLAWTDNSDDETGFTVMRSLSALNEFSIVGSVPPNAASYSDTSVSPATAYDYLVYAENAAGIASSPIATVTTAEGSGYSPNASRAAVVVGVGV